MIRCDTGESTFGTDYNQNMMLWALPAALAGQDLKEHCAPGGMIRRVVDAGKAPPHVWAPMGGEGEETQEAIAVLAEAGPKDLEGEAS